MNVQIDVVRALFASLLLASGVCLVGVPACRPAAEPLTAREDASFDDYTLPRVGSPAEFRQLSDVAAAGNDRPAIAGAKFIITSFSRPAARRIHFLDGRHYRFHDEWAWFRLLNGQPVPGMLRLRPHPFVEPEQARRWAATHETQLPDGLEITDGRLYVRQFYDLSLAPQDRALGAGSLIHVEPRAQRPELWGFEVDYSDPISVEHLLVFFAELEENVPLAAQSQLVWFARSPQQVETGKQLVQQHPEFRGRVLTYSDVTIPGETTVYTSGIVAGRLRSFRELSRLAEATPEDILLLGALPEYLPQARGLVSAIPQTPLAHLNLLAKSRRIVNAYRANVLDAPDLADLVQSRAPVVLSAEDGRLRFQRISEQQYAAWQALSRPEVPAILTVSASNLPYSVDLSRIHGSELAEYAPLIGGKALGMARLLLALGPNSRDNGAGSLRADVPERPLAITVRAYREHLEPLVPELRALLADENFLKFKKLRFLALEGPKEFSKKYPSPRDRELARSYAAPNALGPIAAVVRKGGVRHMIRHAPLPRAVEAELTRALPEHFGAYAATQGLRFRSSSTVEDIEGFNGAGLYDSSTGFLPAPNGGAQRAKRPSVADALRRTWASYFSAEAFEERQLHHIDHLAADMAVLVHARFDDQLEQSNGVFTFTIAPAGNELAVDAQPGAVSVTNPPTDRVVVPESSHVRRSAQGLAVERQSLSSLTKAGQQVVTDAELRELFQLAERIALAQLAQANSSLPAAQQRRALVLDFEFRRVAEGWPALQSGKNPARFVVKQMRPLEPSPRVGAELRAAPIPRDVLSRARRVESRLCRGKGLELEALSVLTAPTAAPDLGYSTTPFLAVLRISRGPMAAERFSHLEHRSAHVNADGLNVELTPHSRWTSVRVEDGVATLTRRSGASERVPVTCEKRLDYAAPEELLRSFLP